MPNMTSVFQNEHRWCIEGQVVLGADAAVGVSRGTNMVWAKTDTGKYTCTVKGTAALSFYEQLKALAMLSQCATLAGALEARVLSVTQTATTGDVVITVLTCNELGAAADTTGACVLNVDVVLRTTPMTAWA